MFPNWMLHAFVQNMLLSKLQYCVFSTCSGAPKCHNERRTFFIDYIPHIMLNVFLLLYHLCLQTHSSCGKLSHEVSPKVGNIYNTDYGLWLVIPLYSILCTVSMKLLYVYIHIYEYNYMPNFIYFCTYIHMKYRIRLSIPMKPLNSNTKST